VKLLTLALDAGSGQKDGGLKESVKTPARAPDHAPSNDDANGR
jgi:hypothetical protein